MKKIHDPLRCGDKLQYFPKKRLASEADFGNERNIILVHGYNASSDCLKPLAEVLFEYGFNPFIFIYNSTRGIEFAAKNLNAQLMRYNSLGNGVLLQNKCSFVCHSMGGLVARVLIQLTDSVRFVSSLVTLGTPHSGTLNNEYLVEILITYREFMTKTVSGFGTDCQSIKELTGRDRGKNGHPILIQLKTEVANLEKIPILSISGGKRHLDVVGSSIFNDFDNKKLQSIFKDNANDGLVLESSSDLRTAIGIGSSNIKHKNDYLEYDYTNHTFMINNADISLQISDWLKINHEPPSPSSPSPIFPLPTKPH